MEYLFHYTNKDILDIILKEQTLKFNNIDRTNDPYENKIFNTYDIRELSGNENHDDYKSFTSGSYYTDNSSKNDPLYRIYEDGPEFINEFLDNISGYEKILYSKKKEMIKITINTHDDNKIFYFRIYNNLKNGIVKTASFCTGEYNDTTINENNRPGYLYPTMWSHYGNKSRGVCLVFNKDTLIKKIYEQLDSDFHIYAQPVQYIDTLDENHGKEIERLIKGRNRIFKDWNIPYKRNSLVNNMIENFDKYFFTKDKDWGGEREFRILIINKEHNNDFCPKFVELDMSEVLRCVVLGENFGYRNEKKERTTYEEELNKLKLSCQRILLGKNSGSGNEEKEQINYEEEFKKIKKTFTSFLLDENSGFRDEEQELGNHEKELKRIKSICQARHIGLSIIKRDIYRSRYILDEIFRG